MRVNSNANDVSSGDESVIDQSYLADTTLTGTETENEPVAGPSSINTRECEYSSENVVARGGVSDDSDTSKSDGVAEPEVSDGDGCTAASKPCTVASEPGTVVSASQGMKRARRPETWKRHAAKQKCYLGEEYVSVHSAAVIKKHAIGSPCSDGWFPNWGTM